MAEEAKTAKAAKKSLTFQEGLSAVLKEMEGETFNQSDTIEVKFKSDFAGFKKGAKAKVGKLSGLVWVKIGEADKA